MALRVCDSRLLLGRSLREKGLPFLRFLRGIDRGLIIISFLHLPLDYPGLLLCLLVMFSRLEYLFLMVNHFFVQFDWLRLFGLVNCCAFNLFCCLLLHSILARRNQKD